MSDLTKRFKRVANSSVGARIDHEVITELERLERVNAALVEIVRDAKTALKDWVCQHAPDECYPESVDESRKRVREGGGTLAYIADLNDRMRDVLADSEPKT